MQFIRGQIDRIDERLQIDEVVECFGCIQCEPFGNIRVARGVDNPIHEFQVVVDADIRKCDLEFDRLSIRGPGNIPCSAIPISVAGSLIHMHGKFAYTDIPAVEVFLCGR